MKEFLKKLVIPITQKNYEQHSITNQNSTENSNGLMMRLVFKEKIHKLTELSKEIKENNKKNISMHVSITLKTKRNQLNI